MNPRMVVTAGATPDFPGRHQDAADDVLAPRQFAAHVGEVRREVGVVGNAGLVAPVPRITEIEDRGVPSSCAAPEASRPMRMM